MEKELKTLLDSAKQADGEEFKIITDKVLDILDKPTETTEMTKEENYKAQLKYQIYELFRIIKLLKDYNYSRPIKQNLTFDQLKSRNDNITEKFSAAKNNKPKTETLYQNELCEFKEQCKQTPTSYLKQALTNNIQRAECANIRSKQTDEETGKEKYDEKTYGYKETYNAFQDQVEIIEDELNYRELKEAGLDPFSNIPVNSLPFSDYVKVVSVFNEFNKIYEGKGISYSKQIETISTNIKILLEEIGMNEDGYGEDGYGKNINFGPELAEYFSTYQPCQILSSIEHPDALISIQKYAITKEKQKEILNGNVAGVFRRSKDQPI